MYRYLRIFGCFCVPLLLVVISHHWSKPAHAHHEKSPLDDITLVALTGGQSGALFCEEISNIAGTDCADYTYDGECPTVTDGGGPCQNVGDVCDNWLEPQWPEQCTETGDPMKKCQSLIFECVVCTISHHCKCSLVAGQGLQCQEWSKTLLESTLQTSSACQNTVDNAIPNACR